MGKRSAHSAQKSRPEINPRRGMNVLDVLTPLKYLGDTRTHVVLKATQDIHKLVQRDEITGKKSPNVVVGLKTNIAHRDSKVRDKTAEVIQTLAVKEALTQKQTTELIEAVSKGLESAGDEKSSFEKALAALR